MANCGTPPSLIWGQSLGSQGPPGTPGTLTATDIAYTPVSAVLTALGVADVNAALQAIEEALDTSFLAAPQPDHTITYFDVNSGDWVTLPPAGVAGIPEMLTIDYATGELLWKPIGSGFHAEGDGTTTVTLNGVTSNAPLNATAAVYDDHSGYNTATATYTVPADGRWLFTASNYALVTGLGSATAEETATVTLRMVVNGVIYDIGAQSLKPGPGLDDEAFVALSGTSPVLQLSAGDTVEMSMGVTFDPVLVPGLSVAVGGGVPSTFSGTMLA